MEGGGGQNVVCLGKLGSNYCLLELVGVETSSALVTSCCHLLEYKFSLYHCHLVERFISCAVAQSDCVKYVIYVDHLYLLSDVLYADEFLLCA